MNTKIMFGILIMTLVAPKAVHAQATGTHGGDACEEKFQDISRQFRQFLRSDRTRGLTLPESETQESFKAKTLAVLNPYLDRSPNSKVMMSCTKEPLWVGSEEKTCVWEDGAVIRVRCNLNRFLYGVDRPGVQEVLPGETLEPIQFKNTIHEWLGIAEIERNQGSISDYQITNQITATGGFVPKFQIGIKAADRGGDNCSSSICAGDRVVFEGHDIVTNIEGGTGTAVDVFSNNLIKIAPDGHPGVFAFYPRHLVFKSIPCRKVGRIEVCVNARVIWQEFDSWYSGTVLEVFSDSDGQVNIARDDLRNHGYELRFASSLNLGFRCSGNLCQGDRVIFDNYDEGKVKEIYTNGKVQICEISGRKGCIFRNLSDTGYPLSCHN